MCSNWEGENNMNFDKQLAFSATDKISSYMNAILRPIVKWAEDSEGK